MVMNIKKALIQQTAVPVLMSLTDFIIIIIFFIIIILFQPNPQHFPHMTEYCSCLNLTKLLTKSSCVVDLVCLLLLHC